MSRAWLLVPLALAVGLLTALLIQGCGPKVTEGEVIGKTYQEAHTYMALIPICTTTGGQYPTTSCVMIPYYMHDDADWILRLRNCDMPGESECAEGDLYVDEATFNSVEVGDYYGDDPSESITTTDDSDVKQSRA
jgi:hypothetical protein